MAHKGPPTKISHTGINNSCVILLNETDNEIDDRHYLMGSKIQNWSKVKTIKLFSVPGK